MPHTHLAEIDLSILVVIDMQQRMMAAIHEAEAVAAATARMIRAAGVFGVPVVYTEQNPAGLGTTIDALRPPSTGGGPLCKVTCSCWGDAPFRERIQASRREHVLLAGVESHVCVQQTALDLLRVDYVPFILADAVSSRRPYEKQVALERMRQAGAVVTTVEAMIFELVQRCDVPAFKQILPIVKD